MSKTNFTNIVVVQSLSDKDMKTGTHLKDDIDVFNVAYDRGLSVDLVNIKKSSEFLQLISNLKEEAMLNGIRPILHIECHGYSDFSGLAFSEDGLSWGELKKPLAELNQATELNLVIVAAACHGARIANTLSALDRAPCWGLLGPTDEVFPMDLLRSFSVFYKELLDSGNGTAAVESMNNNRGSAEPEYYFTTAENLFTKAYKRYKEEYCTEEGIKIRAQEIFNKLVVEKPSLKPTTGQIEKIIENRQVDYFNRYYNRFFMIDVFPQNKKRFCISYDEI